MVAQAASHVLDRIDAEIADVAAFRATVTAKSGSLITILRQDADDPDDEAYPSLNPSSIAVGDVVLCVPLGGKPVIVGTIQS